MAQNGASAEEITQAQSDLAKGLGTSAPQPATELVEKWALLMSSAATMGTGTAAGIGGISVRGAYVGSTIKGEDPTNAMIGAGVGSAAGSLAGKITEKASSEIGGAVVGSIVSEVAGGKATNQLDARKKNNENK